MDNYSSCLYTLPRPVYPKHFLEKLVRLLDALLTLEGRQFTGKGKDIPSLNWKSLEEEGHERRSSYLRTNCYRGLEYIAAVMSFISTKIPAQ